MIKVAIFDLDGTLVHSAPGICYAVNQVLQDYEIPPLSIETVTNFIGQGVANLIKQVMIEVHLDENKFEEFLSKFSEIYDANPTENCSCYEGVIDTLKKLRMANWRLAICTNKPAFTSKRMVKNLNLFNYFHAIIGGDSTPHRKPNTTPLFMALSKLGVAKEQAIFIGDSITDAKTAQNAELPFFLYTKGYPGGDFTNLNIDHKFDNYDQALIKKMDSYLN